MSRRQRLNNIISSSISGNTYSPLPSSSSSSQEQQQQVTIPNLENFRAASNSLVRNIKYK